MPAHSDTDLLARLVSFDSVSLKSNAPIASFISDYLGDNAGNAARIEQLAVGTGDPAKVNLIASCGPNLAENHGRDGLVLCGHLDVVPADEPDWQSDPFTLTEKDGKLIARGAADMKGFDALGLNLLLETARRAGELAHPLVVVLTCDEEVGSLGAKHLAETYPGASALPRNCIIGEPTSLRAVRMHKGHLVLRITLRGMAAHSGSPHLGTNAIEPAGEVLLALRAIRHGFEELKLPTSRFFSAVPHPVLNVAVIRGGGAINVIPDACTIDVGIRLMPGQERDEVVGTVEDLVRDVATITPVEVELLRESPPLLTDEDAPLHRELCRMTRQPDSLGVSFASDAGWLSTLGLHCVLFGPGSIEVAHKPNEALPIDEFNRARRMLQELIERYCFTSAPAATR